MSAADEPKLQPLWNDPHFSETLKTLTLAQLERLVLVLQLMKAEGRFESVCAEPLWAVLNAHMHADPGLVNTLAFWRFQCLIQQGNLAEVFTLYQANRAQLLAPLCCFLDALFLLESRLVSKRPLNYSSSALVLNFKALAGQLDRFDFDGLEVLERAVFPLQLAFRFDQLQAGKLGAHLKEGEKASIQKKVGSHLLFMVPAGSLLDW
jgi:hypothetical protein